MHKVRIKYRFARKNLLIYTDTSEKYIYVFKESFNLYRKILVDYGLLVKKMFLHTYEKMALHSQSGQLKSVQIELSYV